VAATAKAALFPAERRPRPTGQAQSFTSVVNPSSEAARFQASTGTLGSLS
jgi:hypothetical protein